MATKKPELQHYCHNPEGYGLRCLEETGFGLTCPRHEKNNQTFIENYNNYKNVVKLLLQLIKNPGTKIVHQVNEPYKTYLTKGRNLETKLYKLLKELDIEDLTKL